MNLNRSENLKIPDFPQVRSEISNFAPNVLQIGAGG
jgi:hypothetical protein